MKINKNKGKVHPSPSPSSSFPSLVPSDSSSSSSGSNSTRDASTVLNKVLPAAILALTVVLSLGDREVLAYMITRSVKTANPSSIAEDSKKNKKKKDKKDAKRSHVNHEPLFDCDCFDCYTSFWFRWDSSPNRERIHQAIEAFEDHLSNGERPSSKRSNGKGRKKDRRRPEDHPNDDRSGNFPSTDPPEAVELGVSSTEICAPEAPPADSSPEKNDGVSEEEEAWTGASPLAENDQKGWGRKVYPDVLGILNSRLWSLWSPKA